MRPSSLLSLLALVSAVLAFLPSSLSQSTTQYQWAYLMRCAPNTVDYPCLIQVSGTAIVNPTLAYSGTIHQTINGSQTTFTRVPYYNIQAFTGVRNYTNRFGQSYTAPIQLTTNSARNTTTQLYLAAPYFNMQGFMFSGGAVMQFYGGLLGNEWFINNNPYASESVTYQGRNNALNNDYTATVICSTAPGFIAAPYNASDDNPIASTNMNDCLYPSFRTGPRFVAPIAGVPLGFNLSYSVTDGDTFNVSVIATVITDGTIGYDQLGNPYYNLIQMTGTRTYTYLPTRTTTSVAITSLMAQNVVSSSDLAYITNNNRLYTQIPFLDRFGIAYTLASGVAVDGELTGNERIQSVYVYRLDTIEEESLNGDAFPDTNTNNVIEPISITPITLPSTYQLVQYCYSFQGLPNTVDYPWLVVTNGVALIDNSVKTGNITTNVPANYYNMLGFVGLRNYTNKYGVSFVNSLTLDPIGEDAALNQLYLTSPYAGRPAFHINGTIEMPGGLPATDLSVYLNPYPIEGTAYGYGIGTGTNALNNDPSKTVIASTAPQFVPSTFANVFPYTSAGTIFGTTNIAACTNPAGFAPVANTPPSSGVQVYLFNYGFIAPTYTVNASLTVITDGSVNTDALGNYYYNVAALFGTHSYVYSGVTYNTNVSALLPICSGPSVSDLDAVYCNDNRLFLTYPYLDRLGWAYEFSSAQASDGSNVSTTRYGGLYVYRHTVIEEAAPVSYPATSNSPPQSATLTPISGTTYAAVQWGYRLVCANRTLDYPCIVSVMGTAIVASTTPTADSKGLQYLQMVGFVGTRTFYGRYGTVQVSNISMAQAGEEFSDDRLYIVSPFIDTAGFSYYLNGTDGAVTEFQGGLFGNEVNFALQPYATETIAISMGAANTLYYDPAGAVICSNAPGFVPQAYNPNTPASPTGTTNMSACLGRASTTKPTAATLAVGLRSYRLAYTVSDSKTYTSSVSATLFTDGSVNTDSLGNVYYNVISASGTRQYTYIPTGVTTVSAITSVMAQNVVSSSNLAYITNNNRLYPSYPFFDRYGLAFTLNTTFTPDGIPVTSTSATTDILSVLVYRDNTLEEYTLYGAGNFPPTNTNNTLLPLTLTRLPNPPTYQLVQYCYVLYSLNNTLDHPWSVVVSGTALIDNTTGLTANASTAAYNIRNVPYYTMYGFVGTRNFTNKYGQSYINTLTLNALGEDYDTNQLWLQTPYAGDVSFHINGTIETPGGLPATDISIFLNPYPVEGTAYGYGVGGGSNALNNDPSKTIFASNAPGFQSSVYSNVPLTQIGSNNVGTVYGTNDVTQCVAYFQPIRRTVPKAGVKVYQFTYQITNTRYYLITTSLQLITDGTVNTDQLGNFYFNVAAISGTRTYWYYPSNNITTVNITSLMPICSGPSVGNLDAVYCNDNRLFLSFPYVDRLGLAWEYAVPVPNAGQNSSGTTYGGVYSYRETAIEEPRMSQYPVWSDNVNQTATLTEITGTTYTAVQWGYKLVCANRTLDYPCTVSVIGTAIVASTTPITAKAGGQYLQMVGFVGTRTFYGRYGTVLVSNISMAAPGEEYADDELFLTSPFIDADGVTFYLNGTGGALTEFQGGLFGNEVNFAMYPAPTETIAINNGPTNGLYYDPAGAVICSTAPGFVPQAYSINTPNSPAGSNDMRACMGTRSTTSVPAAVSATGLRSYQLAYTVSDSKTYTSAVSATLFTDGTVNRDQLGNVYYNVIAAQGTRTYTYIPTGVVTVSAITSIMAQNIVSSSNLAYITNNNRLYPSYPFFDRYGLAFTLNTTFAPDGIPVNTATGTATTDILSVLVYRDNTLEEYTLYGAGNFPPTNVNNTLLPLTLTRLPNPPTYQLVQYCYVLYSLNNTLDHPWSVVVSGTGLIDNTTGLTANASTAAYNIRNVPYYNLIGFVGTRNFTNKYQQSTINSLTLNALGEDYDTNQLWLQTPYAGGLSFHLNATIQTPGGLPATDIEIFLNPYPVEGTAYGYGVGGGSNALNNDPSKTIFASTAPGFQSSVYSNVPLTQIGSNSVGTVQGTNDVSQCVAYFDPVRRTAPSAGVKVYQFTYQITNTRYYLITTSLQLITDGTVNTDQLGNFYFNVAAISGTRTYWYYPSNNITTVNVTALMPICSGPSVGNLDAVYCNNNRLFLSYPYVDRLGLAWEYNSVVPNAGQNSSGTIYGGVYSYRETAVEEPRMSQYPTWSDNVNQTVTLTQLTGASANYAAYQWGYLMLCPNGSLDYPCSVSVTATVIVIPNSATASTVSGANGALAYYALGLVGTRTYQNRYGQKFVSNISLANFGEDYNDDLLYLAAPFSDRNGLTFRLNGSAGALTEMPGGVNGNEINVYLNPWPVETISTNGAGANSLQSDPAQTVFCSTLPGFVSSSYSATTNYAAGSTDMRACVGPTYSQRRTTLSGSAGFSLSYNISDGKTFISLVSFSINPDGNVYTDYLGNNYWKPSNATVAVSGRRVFYNLTTGVVNVSAIVGVGVNGSYSTGGSQFNSNRIYPQTPYFDREGLTLLVSPNIPTPGSPASSSYFTIYNYRETLIEESPSRVNPVQTSQYISRVSGYAAPIDLSGYTVDGNATVPVIPIIRPSSSSSTGSAGGTSSSSSSGGRTSSSSGGSSISSSSSASSSSAGSVTGGGGVSDSGSSGLSGGAIAGIVIGSVVGALLLLGLCLFIILSTRSQKRDTTKLGDSEASKVQGASVIAPSEVSRTTGTGAAVVEGEPRDGMVELQPMHTSEAQEV